MPRRLPCPDDRRGQPVEIVVDGAPVRGFTGESLAAALLADRPRATSRSLKYHRPRGPFCLDGHCGGCLMRVDGVPNLRTCMVPCHAGAELRGQNALGSTEHDVLGAVDLFFRRGMDHHGLMTGTRLGNRLAQKVVRELSGLGKLPDAVGAAGAQVTTRTADVIVLGGGPAGLAAAAAARAAGADVVVVDEQARAGGSLRVDPRHGPAVADERRAALVTAGVELREGTTVVGVFPEVDGGTVLAATATGLVRLRATAWVWATGGYNVNLPLADNDRPGVVAARAVGRLLLDHAILPGEKLALVVDRAAPEVVAYADALAAAVLAAGGALEVVDADAVVGVRGRRWAEGVRTRERNLDCDLVAVAAVPSPATEGPRQHGVTAALTATGGGFAALADADGRTAAPGVLAAGDVCGYRGPVAAAVDGARAGAAAAAWAAGHREAR